MNQVLSVAGNFLYVVLSVVLMPVFMALDIFLGTWMLIRWTNKSVKRMTYRFKHKHAVYQQHSKKALVLLRAKMNNTTASTH